MNKFIPLELRAKMDQLLDENFIKNFFEGNLKIFFPEAKKINKINKVFYKDLREKESYTLVIEFILDLKLKDNKLIKKSVFGIAHSKEYKNKALYYIEVLYKNGFNQGLYKVPRPLIYIPEIRASFYEGVKGQTLLYYLKHKEYFKIESGLKDAARWLSCLHNFEIKKFESLQLSIKKIGDNHPPIAQVLKDIKKDYVKLYQSFYPLYKQVIEYEKKLINKEFFKVIYGDYHPENIIIPRYSRQGVTVIDFNDLGLGNWYSDVGAFLEQVEFMSNKYMPKEKGKLWQNIFLDEYIRINNFNLTSLEWQKINLYSLWTCLRNIIYYYYKCDPDQVIWKLIKDAEQYLGKIKTEHF